MKTPYIFFLLIIIVRQCGYTQPAHDKFIVEKVSGGVFYCGKSIKLHDTIENNPNYCLTFNDRDAYVTLRSMSNPKYVEKYPPQNVKNEKNRNIVLGTRGNMDEVVSDLLNDTNQIHFWSIFDYKTIKFDNFSSLLKYFSSAPYLWLWQSDTLIIKNSVFKLNSTDYLFLNCDNISEQIKIRISDSEGRIILNPEEINNTPCHQHPDFKGYNLMYFNGKESELIISGIRFLDIKKEILISSHSYMNRKNVTRKVFMHFLPMEKEIDPEVLNWFTDKCISLYPQLYSK